MRYSVYGIRDQTGGIRDQKGGIWDHSPGIRDQCQAMRSGTAIFFFFFLGNRDQAIPFL